MLSALIALLVASRETLLADSMVEQAPFEITSWTVDLTRTWDVLGPFPLSAREQHLILPSFPLDVTVPYKHEPDKSYFSALPDGGIVNWSQFNMTEDGHLKISFPDIRWENIRATEGWAALQHHSIIHSQITVNPPTGHGDAKTIPRLLVDLQRGSFFAVTPTSGDCTSIPTPEWHPGNIYEMGGGYSKASVDLPCLFTDRSTVFDIFISADYEIRLFGDPLVNGSPVPVASISLTLDLELVEGTVKVEETLFAVPDFVNGFAFGDVISVGVRSVNGSWNLVKVLSHTKGFSFAPLRSETIIGSQTREIPLNVTQSTPIDSKDISLMLIFELLPPPGKGKPKGEAQKTALEVTLPIRHHTSQEISKGEPILGTHYQAGTLAFLAIAPSNASAPPLPPIIFLHGAGVDVVTDRTWSQAIPQQSQSWILTPTGRTPWGYDWRGPSSKSLWHAFDSLKKLVAGRGLPSIPEKSKVVLVGHSNGGQGVWHNAARYPDQVLAAVPAAAYVKAQLYIATTHSWSAHFMDPMLRGILDSSLAHDDNDLFLTNMASVPTFAIHGGVDENVPTWHSRLLTSVLRYLSMNETGSLLEIPNKLHWWDGIFKSKPVEDFLQSALSDPPKPEKLDFVLTSLLPSEGGTLKGFRVLQPLIPGRLSRLEVKEQSSGALSISTVNIAAFNLPLEFAGRELLIDARPIRKVAEMAGEKGVILARGGHGRWKAVSEEDIIARDVGRLASVLNTEDIITIVYPPENPHAKRIALRFSWTLNLYLKIDTRILTVDEYRNPDDDIYGNLIVLRTGDGIDFQGSGNFVNNTSGLELNDDGLWIAERKYNRPSSGALILTGPKILHIWGIDHAGLERAALLLPFRTGIYGPEWIVLDDRPGGVAAAGFWNDDWLSWNEGMSWLS